MIGPCPWSRLVLVATAGTSPLQYVARASLSHGATGPAPETHARHLDRARSRPLYLPRAAPFRRGRARARALRPDDDQPRQRDRLSCSCARRVAVPCHRRTITWRSSPARHLSAGRRRRAKADAVWTRRRSSSPSRRRSISSPTGGDRRQAHARAPASTARGRLSRARRTGVPPYAVRSPRPLVRRPHLLAPRMRHRPSPGTRWSGLDRGVLPSAGLARRARGPRSAASIVTTARSSARMPASASLVSLPSIERAQLGRGRRVVRGLPRELPARRPLDELEPLLPASVKGHPRQRASTSRAGRPAAESAIAQLRLAHGRGGSRRRLVLRTGTTIVGALRSHPSPPGGSGRRRFRAPRLRRPHPSRSLARSVREPPGGRRSPLRVLSTRPPPSDAGLAALEACDGGSFTVWLPDERRSDGSDPSRAAWPPSSPRSNPGLASFSPSRSSCLARPWAASGCCRCSGRARRESKRPSFLPGGCRLSGSPAAGRLRRSMPPSCAGGR